MKKALLSFVALTAILMTGFFAEAQHRGPGRPPGRGGGGGGWGDLCQGTYVGNYVNPDHTRLQFRFDRAGGDRIRVTINISSWPKTLYGNGTCRQRGNEATFEFDGNGTPHYGTIRNGYMQGRQNVRGAGFEFQARQY